MIFETFFGGDFILVVVNFNLMNWVANNKESFYYYLYGIFNTGVHEFFFYNVNFYHDFRNG